MIRTGYYKHFKGGLYIVTGLAEHTETGQQLVIYCSTENKSKTWARPVEMFLESVDYFGKKIQRFEFLRN